MKVNIKQKKVINLIKAINASTRELKNETNFLDVFGIDISLDNSNNIYVSNFRYFECKYILEKYDELERDFFGEIDIPFKWNEETKIALALAETQELRNDFLSNHEIESINKFFDLNITKDLIKSVYQYFI